jgi:phage terminase Nu1 subunit (DNA packaging protein)
MSDPEDPKELQALRVAVKALRDRIASVEARAEGAEREANQVREEVLRLRDQVAAAQRDQQDLKTARARLASVQVRGLIARILNRH